MKCLLSLLLVLLLVSPVLAQNAQLFGSVQPGRVAVATVVIFNGENQRQYMGAEAGEVTRLVKGCSGQHMAGDSIQPYTWDWKNNQPREYTPLVIMVAVKEEWEAWTDRFGKQRIIRFEHYNTLSCYEVGDAEVYECRQYQGSTYYEMSYHVNSLQVKKEDIHQLILNLGL